MPVGVPCAQAFEPLRVEQRTCEVVVAGRCRGELFADGHHLGQIQLVEYGIAPFGDPLEPGVEPAPDVHDHRPCVQADERLYALVVIAAAHHAAQCAHPSLVELAVVVRDPGHQPFGFGVVQHGVPAPALLGPHVERNQQCFRHYALEFDFLFHLICFCVSVVRSIMNDIQFCSKKRKELKFS